MAIISAHIKTTNTDILDPTGVVQIDDTLHIRQAIHVPTQPSDGNKLYMQAESYGQTGMFFVNSQGTRDELISKNRSILYSMLF